MVVAARSAIGEGVTFDTAKRRFGSIARSTASVSALRPLCDTPMIGCCEAGIGQGIARRH